MKKFFKLLTTRLLVCTVACAAAGAARGQQAPPPKGLSSDMGVPELILVSPSAKETQVGQPLLNVRVTAASVTPEVEVRYTLNNSDGVSANARKSYKNMPVEFQVKLALGLNQLTIIAVNEKGSSAPIILSVTYEARKRINDDLIFLGIGISRYRAAGMQASYAVSDVQQLGALFKTQEEGSVFDHVHPQYVMNEEATRAALIKGLSWVEDKADEPDDVALVYVSGLFGGESSLGGPYFLTFEHASDADSEINDVSVETILRRLSTVKGRVVLLLEHAGTAGKLDSYIAYKIVRSAPENIAVCMAFPEGASAGPARERGALAEALVAGLRGAADIDRDNSINLEELQNWLTQRSKAGGGFSVTCNSPAGWRPLPLFYAGTR